jgi:glycosyltransferase involved in cell wall biosynthesis
VEFIGQVEGDEKQKLLANAFWTVMPSHTENFGLVVLESLAQNTPVIASKGSPWEVLEKERLGFWVENSPEELSRTLDKIVRMERSEYEDYRSRGRDFVIENFDMSRNISKWSETYRSL